MRQLSVCKNCEYWDENEAHKSVTKYMRALELHKKWASYTRIRRFWMRIWPDSEYNLTTSEDTARLVLDQWGISTCYRFPKEVRKCGGEYCGEFKPRQAF